MGRRVDDDEGGASFLCLGDTRRSTVDHLRRLVFPPCRPLARRCLRIGIDDERHLSAALGGGGQMYGKGRFASPAFLADDRDDGHVHM